MCTSILIVPNPAPEPATIRIGDIRYQQSLPAQTDPPDGTGDGGEVVDDHFLHDEESERYSFSRHRSPPSQEATPEASHTSRLDPIFKARVDAELNGRRWHSAPLLGKRPEDREPNTRRSHSAWDVTERSMYRRVAQYLGPLRPHGLIFLLVFTMMFIIGALVVLLHLASSVSDLQFDLDDTRLKLNGTMAFLNSTLTTAYINTLNESVELPYDAWSTRNGVTVIEPQYLEHVDPRVDRLQLSFTLRNQTAMYEVLPGLFSGSPTDGRSVRVSLGAANVVIGVIVGLLLISLLLAGYILLSQIRSGKRSSGQRSPSTVPSHKRWYWRLFDPFMRLTRRYPGTRKDDHRIPLIPLTELTDEGYGRSVPAPVGCAASSVDDYR